MYECYASVIESKRKCFPIKGSDLILMISVQKNGCPSKLLNTLFQEGFHRLHDDKNSCQAFACFNQYCLRQIYENMKDVHNWRYQPIFGGVMI